MRKPVGICAVPGTRTTSLYVACDDGAMFVKGVNEQDWREMPPIVGSRRDAELAHRDLGDWRQLADE